MKHKKHELDYIVKIRGKKYRIYYGGLLWGLMTMGGAFMLVFGFFISYIAAIIVFG